MKGREKSSYKKPRYDKYLYRSFRVSEYLDSEILEAAEQSDMNISEFIREAIVSHLKKLERKGFYSPRLD